MTSYPRMSGRMFAMMLHIHEQKHFSRVNLATFDQRTVAGAFQRKWLRRQGNSAVSTPVAEDDYQQFHHSDISRKDQTRPLTSFFEILEIPRKKRKPVKSERTMNRLKASHAA